MTRYGDDSTYHEDQDAQLPNAICSDCGADYSRDELDATPWCDACSNKRDAWATAQDLKRMAKAVLATDLTKVRDIA